MENNYNCNDTISSQKPFDELTLEEQQIRIKESALADDFSYEEASYMAHMWENF